MKFRPCIDLHNGVVKQIVGSSLKDDGSGLVENFVSSKSSEEFARMYREDSLYGGHIIKLGPNNEEATFSALEAFPQGMQVGGGVTPQNALSYLKAGASHVIVTSYVFSNGNIDFERLKELVSVVGKERLVIDLSCRRGSKELSSYYYVVTDRWQKYTTFVVNKENLEMLSSYCDEFLVHGVDVEGMRIGIEEDLVKLLADYSPIPVTYAGGVASMEDIIKVNTIGKGRVDLTVGSALDVFGGNMSYKELVMWHHRQCVEAVQHINIVVGSTNPVKINSCKLAFENVFKNSIVKAIGVKAPSNVSDQPMSEGETKQGAINRANNSKIIYEKRGDCEKIDFYIGLEGGLCEELIMGSESSLTCMAWMAIYSTKLNKWGISRTASFPLPNKLTRLVKSGMELGHADDELFGRKNSKQEDGTVGILTNGLIDRTKYYLHALTFALVPFMQTHLY